MFYETKMSYNIFHQYKMFYNITYHFVILKFTVPQLGVAKPLQGGCDCVKLD